jgi:hypothetical protein
MPDSAANNSSRFNTLPTFSLGAMLLLVTVFSMALTLVVRMPQLGVVMLIMLVPGLVRTFFAIRADHRHGQVTSLLEKVEHLTYSALMVVVLYIIAVAIVVGTTVLGLFLYGILAVLQDRPFPELDSSNGFQGMLVWLGAIAAVIVTLRLFWRWWPRASRCTRNEST